MTGRGVGYLDVGLPNLRGLFYTVFGVIVGFALLVGAVVAIVTLDLPATQTTVVEFHNGERIAAETAGTDPTTLFVLIAGAVLLVGPAEELLFRNVIQKYLTECLSTLSAIFLTSVLFSLAHLPLFYSPDPLITAAALAVAFGFSVVLGVAYTKTGTLIVPALIHGLYDAILIIALWSLLTGSAGALSIPLSA